MRIFQISGKGRVGKTTLAELIAKHVFELGYNPVLLPFADAIKKAAEAQGLSKDKDSTKYRDFCQELGARKRAEDPDYWVVKAFETIQEYMVKEIDNKKANKKHYEYVIIQDDTRYMNELALGRDLAATQIFLSEGLRTLPEAKAAWRDHESEVLGNMTELGLNSDNSDYTELFDIVVINDDSTTDLEKIVKESIHYWLDLGRLELDDYDDEANPSDS